MIDREGLVYCEWCYPWAGGTRFYKQADLDRKQHAFMASASTSAFMFLPCLSFCLASFNGAVWCASVSQMSPFLPNLLCLWCFIAAIETFKTVIYSINFMLSFSCSQSLLTSLLSLLYSSLHVPYLFFLFSFSLWYLNYLIVIKNASKMHLPLPFPNNFWLLVQTCIWFLYFQSGMF